MKFTFSVLLLVLGTAAVTAAQQTGVITGTVTSAQTNAPVANAAVGVESTTFKQQVITDSAGKYRVADVPPGTYHIVIRLNQFLPNRMDLEVKGGEQTNDVSLVPELHFSEVTSVTPE